MYICTGTSARRLSHHHTQTQTDAGEHEEEDDERVLMAMKRNTTGQFMISITTSIKSSNGVAVDVHLWSLRPLVMLSTLTIERFISNNTNNTFNDTSGRGGWIVEWHPSYPSSSTSTNSSTTTGQMEMVAIVDCQNGHVHILHICSSLPVPLSTNTNTSGNRRLYSQSSLLSLSSSPLHSGNEPTGNYNYFSFNSESMGEGDFGTGRGFKSHGAGQAGGIGMFHLIPSLSISLTSLNSTIINDDINNGGVLCCVGMSDCLIISIRSCSTSSSPPSTTTSSSPPDSSGSTVSDTLSMMNEIISLDWETGRVHKRSQSDLKSLFIDNLPLSSTSRNEVNDSRSEVKGMYHDRLMNMAVFVLSTNNNDINESNNEGRGGDSILLSFKREHFSFGASDGLDGELEDTLNINNVNNGSGSGGDVSDSMESLSPERDRKIVHFQCVYTNTHNNNNNPRENNNNSNNRDGRGYVTTCMAINARHRLIAVGTEDGCVVVYHINDEFQLFLSYQIPFPFSYNTTTSNNNSSNGGLERRVSSLSWTSDGCALAVGYAEQGFALATAFGRILFSTAFDDDVGPAGAGGDQEVYLRGVSHLFWGEGNFELFLVSNIPPSSISSPSTIERTGGDFFTVPFAKYAIISCNIRDNMRHPFLIGDDRLLIQAGTESDGVPLNITNVAWQVVQIPPAYISENWPVKYAATCADGKRIAIAGKYGFAICTLGVQKWKIFGSQVQERGFWCVGGMVWYADHLIVACQDAHTMAYHIRIYPSDKNLDKSNIVHLEPFGKRIMMLNILYNHLMVLTADNTIRHYVIKASRGMLRLDPVRKIHLPAVRSSFAVQYVDWFIPSVEGSVDNALASASILLLQEGKLSIVDPVSKREIAKLAETVEFCWPYFPRKPVGDLHNVIWAFDGSQASVWFNLLLTPHDDLQLVSQNGDLDPLRIPLDFYPLSVLFHKGVVIGIEQKLAYRFADGACFKSVPKTYLFLQDIIKYLLQRGYQHEAIRYASYYQDYEYFGHSMEILLHRVLEAESESLAGYSRGALLPAVVDFLYAFPVYYDVIVRCARKTEVALWEYLFSIVGDPKELFNHCLNDGDFKTATSFLVILQTMEPFSVSSRLQMELLEKTLEAEEFELCGEIVRYLNSVSSAKISESDLTKKSGPQVGLLAISSEEEQTFYIDILISRHTRSLMQKKRIRTLGKLSQVLNFPLANWLYKERYRSAMLTELKAAFKDVHHQFEWPYPKEAKLATAVRKTSSSDRSAAEMQSSQSRRSTFPNALSAGAVEDGTHSLEKSLEASFEEASLNETTGNRRRARSMAPGNLNKRRLSYRGDLEEEIRSLITATRLSKCHGWCAILATLLLDVGVVVESLQEARQLPEYQHIFEEYKQALVATGNLVYRSFAQSVEQLLGLS